MSSDSDLESKHQSLAIIIILTCSKPLSVLAISNLNPEEKSTSWIHSHYYQTLASSNIIVVMKWLVYVVAGYFKCSTVEENMQSHVCLS